MITVEFRLIRNQTKIRRLGDDSKRMGSNGYFLTLNRNFSIPDGNGSLNPESDGESPDKKNIMHPGMGAVPAK
jgi:hypothetical protein